MKIEGMNTSAFDPIRIQATGVGSSVIAQTSVHQDTAAVLPQKPLQKERPSAEELKKEVSEINAQLASMNRSIQFSIDDSSHDIVVKIVDTNSGKIIRQIPSEEVLRMREHLKDMTGLIVKETV